MNVCPVYVLNDPPAFDTPPLSPLSALKLDPFPDPLGEVPPEFSSKTTPEWDAASASDHSARSPASMFAGSGWWHAQIGSIGSPFL